MSLGSSITISVILAQCFFKLNSIRILFDTSLQKMFVLMQFCSVLAVVTNNDQT